MAVSCGFAMLLALTIVALITFSQPLFQSDSAVVGVIHKQPDLKSLVGESPEGVISRGVGPRLQNLLTSKTGSSSRQQRWTRKLIQCCLSPPGAGKQVQLQAATSHNPRRSVLATFQSDRMVPTGPNPLHNSNRSQVIFP